MDRARFALGFAIRIQEDLLPRHSPALIGYNYIRQPIGISAMSDGWMDENTHLLLLSVFSVTIGFFGAILLDGWAGVVLVVIAVTSFFIASTIILRFLATT
ncbi:hypothetical protein HALLA_07545 [Halostagnicola larsenii XH-48]|uniref:Uncharacterized protein n=1 Tax=Halostagnicola larsenii XH-48 TaxID=797299 RepID=W0JU32_9EURY|nr:hypothetical protein HALLA_07545 [Halostagnicola larsenii XH-48]